MKLLILEPDPVTAAQLARAFQQTEFQFSLARNGSEGQSLLEREPHDVVLIRILDQVEPAVELTQLFSNRFPYLNFGYILPTPLPPGAQLLAPLAAIGFIEHPLTIDKLHRALQHSRTLTSQLPNTSESKTVVSASLPSLKGTDQISGQQDLREWAALKQLEGHIVGPYRIGKKIASDRKGTLYEAVQISVHRPVALKVLRPEFYSDEQAVEEFRNFVSAMVKAQSPYITTVYEVGQANGLIFYARERVQGENLGLKIQKGEYLTEDQALSMVTYIAEALNYEKKSGILHTPLTIDQVLIPDHGVPKLFNNVTISEQEASIGELDEMVRLGMIAIQSIGGLAAASPEFAKLMEGLTSAGRGGLYNWDQFLKAAYRLDLERRSLGRDTEPPISPPLSFSARSRRRWLLTAALVILGAVSYWYFAYQRPRFYGATHLDRMILIPEGPFILQNGLKTQLPAFSIDAYEVTIGQYRKFLEAWKKNPSTIQEHPHQRPGKDHTPDQWKSIQEAVLTKKTFAGVRIYDNTPIFNIDFYDAWAYAHWASKRLPTELEWEKAARGPHGNYYPWGNRALTPNANTGIDFDYDPQSPTFGKTDGYGLWARVGAKSADKSFYGVFDMAGNVSEWTDSWEFHPDFPTDKVPIIRGGNWSSSLQALTTREISQSPLFRNRMIGFRCAASVNSQK